MVPRTRAEWTYHLALSVIVMITLVYSAWRITITQTWLHDYRIYVASRDVKWEALARQVTASTDRKLDEVIKNQRDMLDMLSAEAR